MPFDCRTPETPSQSAPQQDGALLQQLLRVVVFAPFLAFYACWIGAPFMPLIKAMAGGGGAG